MTVVGWDIGGVNTKGALVSGGAVRAVRSRPYELQRAPDALAAVLRELARELAAPAGAVHAVTMTAELSQMFRTKREGVGFVLDAVVAAFPHALVDVFSVSGRFLTPAAARGRPLDVAAANWVAAGYAVAAQHADALLIDVGTTTTDIIPIVAGRVAAAGWTDPDRLATGELVYTGAVRTPAEAIASSVPLHGEAAGVSAEGFALAGDVHVWRGDLDPAAYTAPTPDGRPATREYAGERLARLVCADCEMLGGAAITAIADALAASQIARIAEAIARVRGRHPLLQTAVVAGLGAFIGAAAARACGLRTLLLSNQMGDAAATCAPAAAVALLRSSATGGAAGADLDAGHTSPVTRHRGDDQLVVVKLGGGVLRHRAEFDAVLADLEALAGHRLLIVPGGGPFADAVRTQDDRWRLPDAAAHWMAILAMDQYAHLVAARMRGAVLVEGPEAAARVLRDGGIPVLAPYRWLREADPLPHAWDVTSDSLAAWLAGAVGASRLVLVKPPHAQGATLVDPYFERALRPGLPAVVVTAEDREGLRQAMGWPARRFGVAEGNPLAID